MSSPIDIDIAIDSAVDIAGACAAKTRATSSSAAVPLALSSAPGAGSVCQRQPSSAASLASLAALVSRCAISTSRR